MLRPFLGRLVPVLLKNMVYDEYDEEVQDAEAAEDADQAEEKDQEIKPFISRCYALCAFLINFGFCGFEVCFVRLTSNHCGLGVVAVFLPAVHSLHRSE